MGEQEEGRDSSMARALGSISKDPGFMSLSC